MSGAFSGVEPPSEEEMAKVTDSIQAGTELMLDLAKDDPAKALVTVIYTLGVLLIEHTILLQTLAAAGFPAAVVTTAEPITEESTK